MQIVSLGEFALSVRAYFLEKNKTNAIRLSSAELARSPVSVKV